MLLPTPLLILLFYGGIAIVVLTLFFYLTALAYISDFSVKSIKLARYRKILAIFPHPDDEVFTCGGLMCLNENSTLLVLTKGEKGTPDAHIEGSLKELRTRELEKSAKLLRVNKLIHLDLGDGGLSEKLSEVAKSVEKVILEEKPDLIITYDLSGLYGHPDHMALSAVITKLVNNKFPDATLWYASLPKKVYSLLPLPIHMAKDDSFLKLRMSPTHKVFVGLNVTRKILAMMQHRSQYDSFKKGLPIPVPALFHSLTVFEYFYGFKQSPARTTDFSISIHSR